MNEFKEGQNIWWVDIFLNLNQIDQIYGSSKYCTLVFSPLSEHYDVHFYLDKCFKSKIEALDDAIAKLEHMKND